MPHHVGSPQGDPAPILHGWQDLAAPIPGRLQATADKQGTEGLLLRHKQPQGNLPRLGVGGQAPSPCFRGKAVPTALSRERSLGGGAARHSQQAPGLSPEGCRPAQGHQLPLVPKAGREGKGLTPHLARTAAPLPRRDTACPPAPTPSRVSQRLRAGGAAD